MTAAQIRQIDMSGESEAMQQQFAVSMMQETAAQLAELNARLRKNPELGRVIGTEALGTLEDLQESVRQTGSVIPFIYPQMRRN